MTELKRERVKYIRDYIKKDYKLRDCCFVCGSTMSLELHHMYSVSELFSEWCKKNKIVDINTVAEITALREVFARDCSKELSHENLYTLCSVHHKQLHNIYGQTYANYLAPRIINWLTIQKEKHGK